MNKQQCSCINGTGVLIWGRLVFFFPFRLPIHLVPTGESFIYSFRSPVFDIT